MTIQEILSLDDDLKIIGYLRQRKTPAPDTLKLLHEWDPMFHDVMDKDKRPDSKVLKKEAWTDDKGLQHEAVYDTEPVNRIPIPLEQDITNIQTSFSVGKEPILKCTPNDEGEKDLLSVVRQVIKRNKLKYLNKKIVRSWFAEQEVAEYWYVVKDDGFWAKVLASVKSIVGLKVTPQYKLKCAIWSPFRGDKLYPHFDDAGNFDALAREYTVTDEANVTHSYFMLLTDTEVIKWDISKNFQRVEGESFRHGFKKIPAIYMYRRETLCKKIRPIRERLEKLVSNFADCIDMHFFPKIVVEGDMENKAPIDIGKSKLIKIENGGKVYYLNWEQTSDAVKLELDNNLNLCYTMTKTPRLSLDDLKGAGDVPSGRAFDFLFMGTQLSVENHYEEIGEYMQRRVNFLVSAVGSMSAALSKPSETIDIDVEMQHYSLDDMAEKIKNAKDACGQPIASQKTGILMAGLVEDAEEELKQIQREGNTPAVANSNS
jgi:hypothetical protein